MPVLLVHCDHRLFEIERFGAAWVRAGGRLEELVPVTPDTAPAVLAHARPEALLLSGGPDVEPSRYGRSPEPGVELHCDPPRDALDLELLARADEAGWPVLAICYGCQILAVSRGGTLIQDLPAIGLAGHQLAPGLPKDTISHDVAVDASARHLVDLPATLGVNSRHHQGLQAPGRGLRVVARSADGLIEAVEEEGDRYVVGVQWHPENLTAEPHPNVLRAFRAAWLRSARP